MSATYQAVFFDLGGTLFSYRGLRRGSSLIVDAARRLGVESEPRALGRAYRAASQQAYARLAPQRFYLHRDLFRDTFRSFARELGRDPPEELVSWYEGAQRESLLEHMQPMDDCLEVLNAMRARGLYLSIVSNIDDDLLLPLVEKWGLDQLLDDWTSSEEARSCKPDRAFFELALAKAGRRPDEVLFVGDSPEHDVQGARAIGMTSVLIAEEGATPPLQSGEVDAKPHHEIRSLSELLELVASG